MGNVTEGNLNEASKVLVFTNSREYTYEGTIAMDKNVSGSARKDSTEYEFSMNYNPGNGN